MVTPVLSAVRSLDSICEVSFPRKNIKKVILIFNQPIYRKNEIVAPSSELNARALYEIAKTIRKINLENTDKIQDLVYNLFLKNNSIREIVKNQYFNDSYYSYKYPCIDETIASKNYRNNYTKENIELDIIDQKWNTILSNIFQNFFVHAIGDTGEIFEDSTFIETNQSVNNILNFRSAGIIPQKNSNLINDTEIQSAKPEVPTRSNKSTLKDILNLEKIDQYEYSFSIRSIEFASVEKTPSDKSCFVSKKMQFQGYPLAVKASLVVGESSPNFKNYFYDMKYPISHELSISNAEIPTKESDWLPIMPIGSDYIDSEILFFDPQTLTASTRFVFKKESLILYKNGFKISTNDYAVKEQKIILNTIENNSIYCCSYRTDLTLFNYDNIDFVKSKLFQESTKSFFDSKGQGERFLSTDSLGMVVLSQIPYVNNTYLNSASYSSSVGTVFKNNSQGYSPVKIVMSDGSYAINLTNYTNSKDLPFFSGDAGYYFMQNGKEISFNKKITDPFSVMYEYVSNATRFRLIMRKNIPDISYTGSVDSVLIKAKTKKYDPYFDKLNKVLMDN
jgi:hypothetical protein